MGVERRIREVLWSKGTVEGAGVKLKRAFGFHEKPQFDPFLLLDDFRSDDPSSFEKGFPWHPHRGIETVTYLLTGSVEHGDSLGNRGVINAGDVQWMSAGSGIIHQEMPKGDGTGLLEGFQLWVNLPASKKMSDPAYQSITRDMIPELSFTNGMEVRLVAGDVSGIRGPVRDPYTDPELLDIRMPPHTTYTHPTKRGHTVFTYVIGGEALFTKDQHEFSCDEESENFTNASRHRNYHDGAVLLYTDGSQITFTTGESPVRFILGAGKPHHEPVAWYGPIVMNTRKELDEAFREYQEGTFIKVGAGDVHG